MNGWDLITFPLNVLVGLAYVLYSTVWSWLPLVGIAYLFLQDIADRGSDYVEDERKWV